MNQDPDDYSMAQPKVFNPTIIQGSSNPGGIGAGMLGGSGDRSSQNALMSQLTGSQDSYGKKYTEWQNRQRELNADGNNMMQQMVLQSAEKPTNQPLLASADAHLSGGS